MSHHNNIIDVALLTWHGANVALFGLTISPALENAEAYVRIGSGVIVSISAIIAIFFTLRKNLKKKN